MPRIFYQTTRISVAGVMLSDASDSRESQETCRDVAYARIVHAFYGSVLSDMIMSKLSRNKRHLDYFLSGTYQSSSHVLVANRFNKKLLAGTLLRNQHLVDIELSFRVNGVSLRDAYHTVDKLQNKWPARYEVEVMRRGGIGSLRNDPSPKITIKGGLDVIPAWWWGVIFLRSSYEVPGWEKAKDLLDNIGDEDSIGSADIDTIKQCWKDVLDGKDPSPLHFLLHRNGPVGIAEKDEGEIERVDEAVIEAMRNYHLYSVDLTPEDMAYPKCKMPNPENTGQVDPGA